jgi:hypothetical protein
MGEVRGLFGDVPEPGEPVASCVDALRDLLERAEAGEVIGITIAAINDRHHASYSIGGMVGGYGLLGAIEMAKGELVQIMQGDEE